MVITFYGESCFKIQSGDLTILIDPLDSQSGLSQPRFKHDALIKTLSPFPPAGENNEVVIVAGPGEYDFNPRTKSFGMGAGGAKVLGYLAENESTENFLKTVYIVYVEGFKLCFLGHISEIPAPTVMEHLEEIDVLFVPAGGSPFIDQKTATKIIKQIQPKIIIPTFHKVAGLKRKTEDLKVFLEETALMATDSQEKLTIKKKDLSGMKAMQVMPLKI